MKKVVCIIIIMLMIISVSVAEEPNAYILRRNCDNVVIRKDPADSDYVYWKMVDNNPVCGSELHLTGERCGHWLECVCLYLPTKPIGWVHEGFITEDKPQYIGQTATAMMHVDVLNRIGGRCDWWIEQGQTVKVLYKTNRWATTIFGFVPADALEIDSDRKALSQIRKACYRDWTKKDHLINVIDCW